MNITQLNTINLLVPSDGTTHVIPIQVLASSSPQGLDWASFSAEYFPFFPQSVKVDNSKGTAAAVITMTNTGEILETPAGEIGYFNYAATGNSQPWTITGSGLVNLYWMDYPLIPSQLMNPAAPTNAQNVTVTNGSSNAVPVSDETLAAVISSREDTQTSTGVTAYSTPFVGGSPVASGNPLPVENKPAAMTSISGSATASGSTTIGTPPANSNLRKLVLSIPSNATQATAGNNTISIALDGVKIFEESPYIPATALTSAGELYHRDLDFSSIAANAGASGTLTATLADALTVGSLQINAYFD